MRYLIIGEYELWTYETFGFERQNHHSFAMKRLNLSIKLKEQRNAHALSLVTDPYFSVHLFDRVLTVMQQDNPGSYVFHLHRLDRHIPVEAFYLQCHL